MAEIKIDEVLDTKGLLCPLPVVKAKLAIEEMDTGKVLQVLATDPASPTDFAAWCRETGNTLVDSSKDGKVFVFAIRKG
ncbi:MAG: sulfurtransferase TusA family protein [Dehalococcoidia bacterium]|jgi:TusA-related sulfurtransferase|nr:sulfurtransferase TusA family protein [Dehalococcoidia bacterium]MDP7240769.1 sulfurtransferase TusA family protein [Dehalococcoidia bacterium]